MTDQGATPSARRIELLEAAYAYVLQHGLADLSLRPLAAAVGSSPRVLLYLFDTKDGLVRSLLERARIDELALLDPLTRRAGDDPSGLADATERIWSWLRDPGHEPLLRLWAEAYTRSLVDPDGPWAGFAAATVDDWLEVLASCQAPDEEDSPDGLARRTLTLSVLRGCLLDLLATSDRERVDAAVGRHVDLLGTLR